MRTYIVERRVGITRSPEFEKKGLATHGLNVGLKCSHGCLYCSTPSLLRNHRAFKMIGRTAFEPGFCIVDPGTPERVRRDARKLTARDTVMLCTLTDGWAPEAREYGLGPRCMEILLEKSDCRVRVLTKNAAVKEDFDLMARHAGRVALGLSISAPPSRAAAARVLEPFASPVPARLYALLEGCQMGISTFGMLCPCLPGLADEPEALEEMFDAVLAAGGEEIWLEPVNPRGPGLKRCEEALGQAGFPAEAAAFKAVRARRGWNAYAARLVRTAQHVAERHGCLDRLHVLLYRAQFEPTAAARLDRDSRGLVWLGKGT